MRWKTFFWTKKSFQNLLGSPEVSPRTRLVNLKIYMYFLGRESFPDYASTSGSFVKPTNLWNPPEVHTNPVSSIFIWRVKGEDWVFEPSLTVLKDYSRYCAQERPLMVFGETRYGAKDSNQGCLMQGGFNSYALFTFINDSGKLIILFYIGTTGDAQFLLWT